MASVSEFPLFQRFADDTVGSLLDLYQSQGRLAVIEEAGQQVFFVFGPPYNRQVLTDTQSYHARFFPVRGPRKSSLRRLTAGLLSMNGDPHKRHRRLVSAPFQKRSIVLYRQAVIEMTAQMLDQWQVGQVRNLGQELSELMLRLTSTLLFGFDQSDLALEIGRMMAHWATLNHRLGLSIFVPSDEFIDDYQELLTVSDQLELLIRQMISWRREQHATGDDVLSILLRTHDDEGSLTDDELVGQTNVLFGAAHLTTAHSMTWILLLLAQHPRAMQQVRAELDRPRRPGNPCQPPQTPDDPAEPLPYLNWAVKEGMRLLPASAYSQRVAMTPCRLGSHRVPQGAPVVFSPLVTHRLPDVYANPARFEPERWERLVPTPYEYLPFAAGPRMCLGAPLAMMIIQLVIPQILRRFHLQLVADCRIDARIISTMLTPDSPVLVRLAPRTANNSVASPISGNICELVAF